jgi:hypothetical protein
MRETTLDDVFIHALIPHQAPKRFGSGAVVRVAIHNIGGLRRYQHWEIGDIAIIVNIVAKGAVIARKIGILQAKRLYPTVGDVEDEDEVGFLYGMNAMLKLDPKQTSMLLHRTFQFKNESTYKELTAGSEQVAAIDGFTKKLGGSSVYYLTYNPAYVPLSVRYPIRAYKHLKSRPKLGARVYPAGAIHSALGKLQKHQSPSLALLMNLSPPAGGWRLEHWAADEMLRCRVGRPFSSREEIEVSSLLERRSGPIGAAIDVRIELSD